MVSTPYEVARAHQLSRIALAYDTVNRAATTWRAADLDYLDASWNVIAPALVDQVSEAQRVAASRSDAFVDDAVSAQGAVAGRASVNPDAFTGVMIDGREVGPAMFGAVTHTKTLIGAGMPPARAFEGGAQFLATVVQSAIADAGRQSDRVSMVGKQITRYIRVISPGACSRCAILAGTASAAKAFERHNNCHCTACPLPSWDAPIPKGFYRSADEYFDSLSLQEQNRVFTNAGAEAIRNGADPTAIVNARRGAVGPGGLTERRSGIKAPLGYDANGDRIKVFTTSEGTTIRGAYGRAEARRQSEFTKGPRDRYRRTVNPRLMPETIVQMAGGDAEKMRRLLGQYGYLN
ncbi:hypothetical protein DEI83_06225 [Curtobacterium sp. MCBD17_021]|nr:hypothetical protein DEI83_06225 [Curtobacterium sp. MCBD17_021]